jgi:DNA modification methylase
VTVTILTGDSRTVLATLPDASAQTCVTSPPYFGLRDYGHAGQIGLEPSPDAYVAELVDLFREVRRVLKDDGTLWLNLGDSYAGSGKGGNPADLPHQKQRTNAGSITVVGNTAREAANTRGPGDDRLFGAKPKDLLGIPWRVAFALQADGWYLRSDIIWHKPNPMPESVTDRPTKAHEYVFLLSKSARYYYDAKAIAEEAQRPEGSGNTARKYGEDRDRPGSHIGASVPWAGDTRNARTVWSIATQPFKGSHFATMPPELARRCILAGSKAGDMVLDPFGGAGTTGLVADRLGRDATLIELNPAYAEMARQRIAGDAPLLVEVA